MELKVTTLEGKEAGSVQLSDEIFGLEPRKDIIQRCVNWQLAKRQAGTHMPSRAAPDVWPDAARSCTSRRAPAAPVTAPATRSAVPGWRPRVRSGRCASHALRSAEEGARNWRLRHALSAKAKDSAA